MTRLDLGCGGRGSRWPGFLGVDRLPAPEGPAGAPERYLELDLVSERWPWPAGSVDEIIALHVIEHLKRADGRALIGRALRALAPGRTLTVTCPDLEKVVRAYVARDTALFETRHNVAGHPLRWPGASLADQVNWVIHSYGHKWAYDLASLTLLATEAGAFIEDIRPVSTASPYYTKPDHETGIVILARGDEGARAHVSPRSAELEHRLAVWAKRERGGH